MVVIGDPLRTLIVLLLAVEKALETVILLYHLLDLAYLIHVVAVQASLLIVELVVDQCTEHVSQLLVEVSRLLLDICYHPNGFLSLSSRGILRPEPELATKDPDRLVGVGLVVLQVADFLDKEIARKPVPPGGAQLEYAGGRAHLEPLLGGALVLVRQISRS